MRTDNSKRDDSIVRSSEVAYKCRQHEVLRHSAFSVGVRRSGSWQNFGCRINAGLGTNLPLPGCNGNAPAYGTRMTAQDASGALGCGKEMSVTTAHRRMAPRQQVNSFDVTICSNWELSLMFVSSLLRLHANRPFA